MKITTKLVRLMHPRCPFLIHIILLVAHYTPPPQEYGQNIWVRIVKIIDDQKKLAQHPSQIQFYVQLIMINMSILCHMMTSSITLKTSRVSILCGNPNKSWNMRANLLLLILLTKYLSIMT